MLADVIDPPFLFAQQEGGRLLLAKMMLVSSCWSVFHCFSSSGFNQIFRAKDALQLQDTESRKCHARSNFIKMTVWVPPTFCCFVHLVNDSHHSYYSYFIITPLGKATQVRMWPRWLTRHNRRKWINRRWKKAKAGSIVWVGSLVGVYPTKSGWWLGTWVLFSHILGIIIPTDFDIFQRGWNHQPDWIWLLGDSGQVNFSSGDHCQSYWMFFFVVL